MSTVSISDARAISRANAEAALTDIGDTPGFLMLYTGTVPEGVEQPFKPNNVNVCQIFLNDPAYLGASMVGDVAEAPLNATPPPQGVVYNGGGEITFYRELDGFGTTWRQGSVTDSGGDGDLKLATTTVSDGQLVRIS